MGDLIFKPGDVIFQPGDESKCAYIVVAGEVEILSGDRREPTRLARLAAGQIFGEMGLVDERPRTMTARAVEAVQVRTVTQDELLDLLSSRPAEALPLVRTLFERLRAMNTRATSAVALRDAGSLQVSFAVTLFPLTSRTALLLPASGLRLSRLPFRLGRMAATADRAVGEMNDLALPDTLPYSVSRHHLSIEVQPGRVVVRDRGSFLGTIVNGKEIGGRHDVASAELDVGVNEITLGNADSPFRFRVVVERHVPEMGPGARTP